MPTTPSRGGGVGGYSADTLYFTTEFSGDNGLNTGRIYLGGTLMAKPSVWEELPEPSPYQMVDLGLSSGLKWADRNVGAATPEAIGDYFMFGSTTPDTDKPCDWAHAPFNDGATAFNETYFSEHVTEWFDFVYTQGPILLYLKPEYDAATQVMGGSWRMPTLTDVDELLFETTQSVEELNGVRGMRFTSNANGNSIFMPLAGIRIGSVVDSVGIRGYAWSLYLNAGYTRESWYLDFANSAITHTIDRSDGLSVRGVC